MYAEGACGARERGGPRATHPPSCPWCGVVRYGAPCGQNPGRGEYRGYSCLRRSSSWLRRWEDDVGVDAARCCPPYPPTAPGTPIRGDGEGEALRRAEDGVRPPVPLEGRDVLYPAWLMLAWSDADMWDGAYPPAADTVGCDAAGVYGVLVVGGALALA